MMGASYHLPGKLARPRAATRTAIGLLAWLVACDPAEKAGPSPPPPVAGSAAPGRPNPNPGPQEPPEPGIPPGDDAGAAPDAPARGDPAPVLAPDPPEPPPPVACPPGERVLVVADRRVPVGKTAGAAILGCDGPLPDVSWAQTSGPPVQLLSHRTQAISFDPPEPGTYTFSVAYRQGDGNGGGTTTSKTATVVATRPPAVSRLTIRSDQAVRELGNISLRAWPTLAFGEVMAEISWQQLEGPMMKLETADPRRIVFKAPEVERDTALVFRATVRTTSGVVDSDNVVVVVENQPQAAPEGFFSRIHVSRVYPFRRAGKYADRLVGCVFRPELDASNGCPLSTLPLIAQETVATQLPSVDQIMDRVLVSHDWAGENFEQFLLTQDPDQDFRRMFAAVTAIVIGVHIRPPIYYGATGAIYLDAEDLWLNPAQRDTTDESPDYRLAFSDGLTFSGLTRWTSNNNYAWTSYRRDTRATRTLASITSAFGRVLYHELSHASDFFPPSLYRSLDSSKTPNQLYLPRFRANELPSSQLAAELPLTSGDMKSLGQVMFAGVMATDRQKAFQPAEVADFFRGDRANDTYSYSTAREDLAMLVEEFMMAYRRGIRRDIAITNKYMASLPSDQIVVSWGQRGRIADPSLKARLQLVLAKIAPWIDPASLDALPPPLAMPAGAGWYSTVQLPAPPRAAALLSEPAEEERRLLEEELTRRAQHLQHLQHLPLP
jgi:hypothetical protein